MRLADAGGLIWHMISLSPEARPAKKENSAAAREGEKVHVPPIEWHSSELTTKTRIFAISRPAKGRGE
jgi:hypothetical protein